MRFRVPAGVHVALCSINGNGRLSLLQQVPPQNAATELIYPGPDQTRGLEPPAGTESPSFAAGSKAHSSRVSLRRPGKGFVAAPTPSNCFDNPLRCGEVKGFCIFKNYNL